MPKIRLFFKEKFLSSKPLMLKNGQAHYVKNVMRRKDGDKINVFNHDEEWTAKLIFENKIHAELLTKLKKLEDIPDVWVCFALIKSKNLSYLIEKVSEIGVKKIIPLITNFSENYNLNYSRLEKIAIESVEQSEGMLIPEIEQKTSLSKLFENWDEERMILFCDEQRVGKKISKIDLKKKIAIFIGPVGGWSEKDKNSFKKFNFHNISLGKNILKVDTACIVSLANVRNFL